ncbi:MAG: MBL fold metallo-hydrolase [Pseudomonadota bacterium]
MSPRLCFHGGAGTVTGSRYLLTADKDQIMVDAGLFQGLKALRKQNWKQPPFEPRHIHNLLLTHAHIDHAGYLPRMVHDGFRGTVHCTAGTRDLARLLLKDAAHLQEEDARYANRKGFSKHRPALPLCTAEDARKACDLMRAVDYGQWFETGANMQARFLNMGHILGSAMVETRIGNSDDALRVVFSGDVGRFDVPLHSDPDPLPPCDYLVIESTYGDRDHQHEPVADQILATVKPVLERGGIVLIPSFAVGRAQLITLSLRELMNDGRLPDTPIHIDSPMAVDATRLYSKHIRDLSLDGDLTDDGRSRLFPNNVHFHRATKESIALNELKGPRIIISASGMLSGGRVLHHLKRLAPDPNNLVMLVGYQAAGTRGRKMLDGHDTVRVHGKDVPLRAEFKPLSGLSAHADRNELLRWVKSAGQPPHTVLITHGEPDASAAFAKLVHQETGAECITPSLHDCISLESHPR